MGHRSIITCKQCGHHWAYCDNTTMSGAESRQALELDMMLLKVENQTKEETAQQLQAYRQSRVDYFQQLIDTEPNNCREARERYIKEAVEMPDEEIYGDFIGWLVRQDKIAKTTVKKTCPECGCTDVDEDISVFFD